MRLIRGDGRVIEYALAPHNLDIKPSAAPGKQQSPEESDEEQSSGHPYGDSHRYRHQRDDDEGRQGVRCNQGRRTLQLLADRPRAARYQRQHVRSANRADNANCGTHAVVDCIHIAVDRLARRVPHVESDETVERKKDDTGRKIRAESPDESGPEALQYVSVLTFVDCARDLEQRLRGRRRPDWTCQ